MFLQEQQATVNVNGRLRGSVASERLAVNGGASLEASR